MRIRIAVTLDLDDHQVRTLARMAKDRGHSWDNTKAPGKLIRRMLESKIGEIVESARDDEDPEVADANAGHP